MSNTVQKNFRLSTKAIRILDECARIGQTTDTKVVELCIACYALELGVEVKRARDFLFDNLTSMIASHHAHRPRKPRPAARPAATARDK